MKFAIRIPGEALSTPQGFLSWINAHMVPCLPVEQTQTSMEAVSVIHRSLGQKVQAALSFEKYRSAAFLNGQTAVSAHNHKAWMQLQDIEVHADVFEPGKAKMTLVISGPDAVGSGLVAGHEVMGTFGYHASYHLDDTYMVGMMSEEDIQALKFTESARPVSLEPFNQLSYTAESSKNATNEQFLQLVLSEFTDLVTDFAEDNKLTYQKEKLAEVEQEVTKLYNNAFVFSGSFHHPTSVSLYSTMIPTKGGYRLLATATTTLGRMYRMALSPFDFDFAT